MVRDGLRTQMIMMRGIVEKLSNGDVFEVAFDFDSDAILLDYPRYAEHTERLHRHHWKVKNLSLSAVEIFLRSIVKSYLIVRPSIAE